MVGNLDYEDFMISKELREEIVEKFPEDYNSVIRQYLSKVQLKDNTTPSNKDEVRALRHKKIDVLSYTNSLFLNDFLNMKHLYSEEEMKYLSEVRTHISNIGVEIKEEIDQEFLSRKGKLNESQKEKYSEKKKLPDVDKSKIEKYTKKKSNSMLVGFIYGSFFGMAIATLIFLLSK